jgi:ribonuclease P protein component
MDTPTRHTFSKQERLKSRKLIDALFRSGKTFQVFPFRVFYLWEPPSGISVQVGVGASKRNFKRAVDRNRIKRLMREGYRLQKQLLEKQPGGPSLRVFILYTGKVLPALPQVMEKMAVILTRLRPAEPGSPESKPREPRPVSPEMPSSDT